MFFKNINFLIFALFLLVFTSCKPDQVTAIKNSSFSANRNPPAIIPPNPITGSSITLQSPTISPNNISTPTFLVSGVVANTIVKLYTNSSCTAEVGQATAVSSSVVVTASLSMGSYNFYTKSFNSAGLISTCSIALASYIYNTAPANLSYSPNPVIYTIGNIIANNTPFYTGDVATYFSISKALPAGLYFDTITGIISGTPNEVSPSSNYFITATNAGGSTYASLTLGVAGVGVPSSFSYTYPSPIYTNGVAIANNLPSYAGEVATNFSVSPALPAGLTLNSVTGIISGTPTAVVATTFYTVTLTNSLGTTSATISIRVASSGPPTALTYSSSTSIYTNGTTITNNSVTYTGGLATSFTVSPTLPYGLILNPTTGLIFGTPSAITSATSYTVTASNLSGSTTTTISITVLTSAPTGISYTSNPAYYTNGTMITSNAPTVSGGAATSFTVTPALPAGLIFNTTTGVITGTPTATTAIANYTIKAINSSGNFSNTLTLRVETSGTLPTGLSYTTSTANYVNGTTITNNIPLYSGSAALSFSISPALPAGLNFNTTTGIISGTPTSITTAAPYTVTLTNDAGSTTGTVIIAVLVSAPTAISYTTATATYINGVAITNNTPATSGGAPTVYSISQALPNGLIFNTATGVISGTPTVLAAQTYFTITGSNISGSISTNISIAILAPEIVPITATSMTRLLPTISPSSIATPSFTLSGLVANTTAKLYTDAACSVLVGSAYATTTSVTLTSSALTVGTYNFYTKSVNAQGTSSACSGIMLSYTYTYLIDATFSYEFIPTASGKLDYANKSNRPLREVYIEMKKASDHSIISTGSTDVNGNIKFYLTSSMNVYFDISAEIKSPSVIVIDNTNAFAKYVAGTATFVVANNITINQVIPSGWSGSNTAGAYTSVRAAAPFAILDSVYSAMKKIKDTGRTITYPALSLAWSINNVSSSTYDVANGLIGTSAFWPSENRIYILGKADSDTDEYDRSVIVHEWGHYFEHNLSRANNIGGAHGPGDIEDISLSWGEGWPNALSAIVFDPDINYVDTSGARQQSSWSFSLDNSPDPYPGWYSESSIQQLFFRLSDSAYNNSYDNIGLGLGPLIDLMLGAQKTTSAMTSVFSFISALKTAYPGQVANIDTLVTHYGITAIADKYGTGETHSAGYALNLPIYNSLMLGGPSVVVQMYGYSPTASISASTSAYNNKYIKFTATSASTRISLASTDLYGIDIFENGILKASNPASYPYNLTTTAGKEYVLRIYTDGRSVTNQNNTVSVTVSAIAQ